MAGSTPIYGFPYPQSTDLVADYPTLGQELATDVETVISGLGTGLSLVTPTTISNSGGTASASGGTVTFSGVTSLSLNGIFSATYENYRLEMKYASSTDQSVLARMRVGGADATGSNYDRQYIRGNHTSLSGSRNVLTGIDLGTGGSNGLNALNSDIYAPFSASHTVFISSSLYNAGGLGSVIDQFSGFHGLTTSYTGLTIYVGGNITGTIRIYGYQN